MKGLSCPSFQFFDNKIAKCEPRRRKQHQDDDDKKQDLLSNLPIVRTAA